MVKGTTHCDPLEKVCCRCAESVRRSTGPGLTCDAPPPRVTVSPDCPSLHMPYRGLAPADREPGELGEPGETLPFGRMKWHNDTDHQQACDFQSSFTGPPVFYCVLALVLLRRVCLRSDCKPSPAPRPPVFLPATCCSPPFSPLPHLPFQLALFCSLARLAWSSRCLFLELNISCFQPKQPAPTPCSYHSGPFRNDTFTSKKKDKSPNRARPHLQSLWTRTKTKHV